jgi:hypothetical protein
LDHQLHHRYARKKNGRRNTNVLTTALCDQYDKIEIVGL